MSSRKHIVIDADILSGKSPLTGLGIYVDKLVSAIAQIAPEDFRFTLLYHGSEWHGKNYGSIFETAGYAPTVKHSTAIFLDLGHTLKKMQADLFHVTCTTGAPPFPPCPVVTTVHDLYPILDPAHVSWKARMIFTLLFGITRRFSNAFLCNSRFTMNELKRIFPRIPDSAVTYSHLAPQEDFSRYCPGEDQQSQHAGEKYIFCAGALEYRKGQDLLLNGYLKALEKNPCLPDLYFAGTDRGLGTMIQNCPNSKVHWLRYLSPELFKDRMIHAALCVFPSRYEGFGIPLLEALSAGRRVFCGDIPVFRETGGDIPEYIPLNPDAFAEAILHFFGQEEKSRPNPLDEQQYLRKVQDHLAQYSWVKTAEDTLQLYRNILSGGKLMTKIPSAMIEEAVHA